VYKKKRDEEKKKKEAVPHIHGGGRPAGYPIYSRDKQKNRLDKGGLLTKRKKDLSFPLEEGDHHL